MGFDIASRATAVSSTVRVRTPRVTSPSQSWPWAGPRETRPRVGFNPTRPHSLAGIRIEPPPSPAVPSATMPDATAAAVPPLEPPVERDVSHGLRVGPYASGSVVGTRPISGQFDFPRKTAPVA